MSTVPGTISPDDSVKAYGSGPALVELAGESENPRCAIKPELAPTAVTSSKAPGQSHTCQNVLKLPLRSHVADHGVYALTSKIPSVRATKSVMASPGLNPEPRIMAVLPGG